jgi:hypothetical protein
LAVKEQALDHEEILLNILAALEAVLFLVKAMAALVERMRLVKPQLDMVVAVAVAVVMEQHQTTLVELASKALSELRSITNENSHYEF